MKILIIIVTLYFILQFSIIGIGLYHVQKQIDNKTYKCLPANTKAPLIAYFLIPLAGFMDMPSLDEYCNNQPTS